jgi:hypothetical protein
MYNLRLQSGCYCVIILYYFTSLIHILKPVSSTEIHHVCQSFDFSFVIFLLSFFSTYLNIGCTSQQPQEMLSCVQFANDSLTLFYENVYF